MFKRKVLYPHYSNTFLRSKRLRRKWCGEIGRGDCGTVHIQSALKQNCRIPYRRTFIRLWTGKNEPAGACCDTPQEGIKSHHEAGDLSVIELGLG